METLTVKQLQEYLKKTGGYILILSGGKIMESRDESVISHNLETLTETVLGGQSEPVSTSAPGYECLARVLDRALDQAACGKGKERHAKDLPFDQQPMQQLIGLYGPGFALGQAAKKAQESQRLPRDRAIAELLGAINYLAGAVVYLENEDQDNG